MAHLKKSPDGHLHKTSTGHLAKTCGGEPCGSYWGTFTAGDWGGEWNGGYCESPEPTDFFFWTGDIISYLGVTQFEWQAGNANTLALSGDQLTGAIEMTGLDATGDNGLDCSGCTLTATF